MAPLLRCVLTVAMAAALIGGCSRTPVSSPAGTGPPAPVRFVDLGGLHAELAARRNRGRPVLLNFWATWCLPCIEELPDLAAGSREFADRGPEFLGVSLDAWVIGSDDETERRVRDALARAGVTYPNLIYRGDRDPLVGSFGLPGPIPYSILFDAAGHRVTTWNDRLPIEDLRREAARIRQESGGT